MKRIVLSGLVCCFMAIAIVARGSVTFDFEGTPTIEYQFWNSTLSSPVIKTEIRNSFEEHMTQNRFFWGNDSISNDADTSLVIGDYSLAKMTWQQGNIAVNVKGAAHMNFWSYEGVDYPMYTTGGAAVSRNSASGEIADYANHSLLKSTSVYAPASQSQNSSLVFYQSAKPVTISNKEVASYLSPQILFGSAVTVESLDIANTAYAAAVMTQGNWVGYQFSYDYNDFLGITISALDKDGNVISDKQETHLLADFITYSSADSLTIENTGKTLTYKSFGEEIKDVTTTYKSSINGILDDWLTLSLEDWGDIYGIEFFLFSSDYSMDFGANTPLYFAIDNLVFASDNPINPPNPGTDVPEPSTILLLALGFCGWICFKRKNARFLKA